MADEKEKPKEEKKGDQKPEKADKAKEAAVPEGVSKEPKKKDKDKDKGKKKEEKKDFRKDIKKDKSLKEDFRYIVRLVDTDLVGTRTIPYALTSVPGVGVRMAHIIANLSGFPQSELIGNLSEPQTEQIEKIMTEVSDVVPEWMVNRQRDFETGDSFHLLGTEVETRRRDDVNQMKMIRCYKGIRHELGQKVRGQRTRSNGRSGLTLGVTKKSVKEAAAKKEEASKKEPAKKEKEEKKK